MIKKRAFDFDVQVNKLAKVFKDKINTEITANKTYNAVFSVAEKSGGAEFEIIAFEKDFIKYGDGVVNALKDANVKYSVLLISVSDLNFKNPKKIFGIKSSEVIVLGGKQLISYVLFYASMQTKNIHAVLTEPYLEGLLGNLVTVPDGGFFKSINVSKLKTIILDKSIISKADESAVAYSYVKSISKFISLIDYKYALLTSEKTFNQVYYDRARLAMTLVANINSFTNYIEVLTYASLLNAEVLYSSNVLSDGGQTNVAHVIELQLPSVDKGDAAYVAFDRVLKLYHAFFTNDFGDVLSVADYNGDVAKLSKISSKEQNYFYNNLKIPSAKRIKIINKLLNVTRSGFKKETTELLKMLSLVKSTYLTLSNKKSVYAFKYVHLKNAVQLAPYLSSQTTVLTTIRDFGILNTLK